VLHREGEEIGGALWEAALLGAQWEDPDSPGDWVKVVRSFRDGHTEEWWALEVDVGPYGPQRAQRERLLATTDPERLPDKATWGMWLPTCPTPTPSGRRRANVRRPTWRKWCVSTA
jgi:hypothetical protein